MSFNSSSPPDWLMPEGVSKTQWEYISNEYIAENYDSSLKDNPNFHQDLGFLEKHFNKTGIILDLGCGTGRVAEFFAPKNYKVLGVDLSKPMLLQAKNKEIKGPHLFLRANMLELSQLSSNSINYSSCLFSSFGMLLDQQHRIQMLNEIFRVLKPGGKLILHVHNMWSAAKGLKGYKWLALDLIRRLSRSTHFGNKLLPIHQGISGLTLHLFTWKEISTLLKTTNFQIIETLPLGNLSWIAKQSPSIDKKFFAHGFLISCNKV
ncbi:MAG: class I SAM-dependent methyltransferase [Planctomycetes bacterium]|nr:class I SAM-dependent methyltransferase [Planctomycetota bacterium]NBY03732.1 class I SAM-dependent methyltransferase [Planctomycetota bacterium]